MFLLLESIAGNVTSIFLIKEELFLPLTLHFLLIGMIAFMSNVRVMSPLFKTWDSFYRLESEESPIAIKSYTDLPLLSATS